MAVKTKPFHVALRVRHHKRLAAHHERARRQIVKHLHRIRNHPHSYRSGVAPKNKSSGVKFPKKPAGLTQKAGSGWDWHKKAWSWIKQKFSGAKKTVSSHAKKAWEVAKKEGKKHGATAMAYAKKEGSKYAQTALAEGKKYAVSKGKEIGAKLKKSGKAMGQQLKTHATTRLAFHRDRLEKKLTGAVDSFTGQIDKRLGQAQGLVDRVTKSSDEKGSGFFSAIANVATGGAYNKIKRSTRRGRMRRTRAASTITRRAKAVGRTMKRAASISGYSSRYTPNKAYRKLTKN